jgi:hypothetical protein
MKVLSVLIITIIMMVSSAFAQTIQSEFIPSQSMTQVKEGDLVEATIRVWPIENADLTQFKKLEKTLLFNALYLAQITSLGVSQNNADVVELKGLFIVKTAKAQPIFAFKYNDTLIELKSGALAIAELQGKNSDFYILDQSLNQSIIWMIILGVLIVLLVLAVIKRKVIKEFLIGLKPDSIKKARKKYDEVFRRAAKREDFEAIYKDKETWMALLVERAPAHFEFLKTLNQHQFKKDWGNAEIEEVKSSFDIIRRSFEK